MKLSIVIICWNDLKVIGNCLASIFEQTSSLELEVIVSDNGSTDGSLDFISSKYPAVKIIRNGANLGFAKGNNVGIKAATGDYILILNPDTIIRDRALEKMVAFAEKHVEAGAFGCKVLNPDGSFQNPARPLPSVGGSLIAALCLRWLGFLSEKFLADLYVGWAGDTEREIGYQSGCCVLFRTDLLKRLQGFDERFFYHYEETDLCCRVWQAGSKILYCPGAEITHLGGQSVGRFPIRFTLETYRGAYRYFYKHFGSKSVKAIRRVYLVGLGLRFMGYRLLSQVKRSEALSNRLQMYRVALKWHYAIDPQRFIECGEEPESGYEPLAPAPRMAQAAGVCVSH